MIRVLVQARMGSARFPGKALAPLGGVPVIEWVIDRVSCWPGVVLCTSWEHGDDPLAGHVASMGVSVHRGSEDNVVARLQGALREYPCDRFFRVSADSPLLDPGLFRRFLEVPGSPDLVTNVFPRSFPKGQSLELIRTNTFLQLDSLGLTPEQREHPTRYIYDHPREFSIVNVENVTASLLSTDPPPDVAVDTIEDLHRIEKLL